MKVILLNIILYIATVTSSGNIYSIHFTTIDGKDKSMQEFQGKKILIVVLPSTKGSNDSDMLRTVGKISIEYAAKLSVIAVPSIEDGFSSESLLDLQNYYFTLLGDQVTIAAGMYTKKTSANQDALFSWLTHQESNTHFDVDVEGAGQKFFVSDSGELYGVMSPGGQLSTKVLQRLVQ